MLVELTKVEQGTFSPSIVATGAVRPEQEITLSPQVSGQVISLAENFTPGGYVAAGEGATALVRNRAAWPEETFRTGQPPLMVGSFVEVRIEGKPIANVIRMNRGYLRQNDTVWVMQDGQLRILPVENGFMAAAIVLLILSVFLEIRLAFWVMMGVIATLTTFGGLTPIILETSRQAAYLIPKAISLGFGIVFATSIILLYLVREDPQRLAGKPAVNQTALR